jgi:hypothetical protein
MRTNPMNSNVAWAVGVALREQYNDTLTGAVPTPLIDLLVRLSRRSSPVSEVANHAKGLPAPLSIVAAKYDGQLRRPLSAWSLSRASINSRQLGKHGFSKLCGCEAASLMASGCCPRLSTSPRL